MSSFEDRRKLEDKCYGRIYSIKGYEIAGFSKTVHKGAETGGEPFLCLPHLRDTALKKIPIGDIEHAITVLKIKRYFCSKSQLQLLKDSNIPLDNEIFLAEEKDIKKTGIDLVTMKKFRERQILITNTDSERLIAYLCDLTNISKINVS